MTITYTLKPVGQPEVEQEINGFQNVVTRVIWDMIGVDEDGFTDRTGSSTEFPLPTEGQPFTAFNDLTEATIVGWIEQHTDPDYIESRKAIVADLIAKQRNPWTPPKAPWIEEPAASEEPAQG